MTAAGTKTRSSASRALERVLKPGSIAFVGLSDTSPFGHFIAPTLQGDAEVFMVNPRYETVLGLPTVSNLTAIGKPVDAVISFMAPERTTDLVEEAAGLGTGGLVLVAGGFAEASEIGEEMQDRIRKAAVASGMAVIGPNGLGFVNVPHDIHLTIASQHKRRPGGISVVSHSGAMLSGVAMASWNYDGVGLNVIISAGNEAVTDLADYVDYFAGDPETTAIGLIIEKIRRPQEFFAAARRAAEAGKPIVALKLARGARSRAIAASHTASLTGDAWVYDVALRQSGVALAYDPDELIDRLALFDQIPRSRRTAVRKLGVVTQTGGFASLSYDLATTEGIPMPELESFAPWIRETLPGVTVPNPLDTTGVGARIWPEIITRYANSDELDSLLVVHPLSDADEIYGGGTRVVGGLAEAVANVAKPAVAANCSGVPGAWARQFTEGGAVALGRGLRASLRGLQTLGAFTAYEAELAAAGRNGWPVATPTPIGRPAGTPVHEPEGDMLPFADTMQLLAGHGIPVAPYLIVPADQERQQGDIPFSGPYVVKLADVAHRTEHNAVRLNVAPDGIPAAIADLRAIAASENLAEAIAIQPMISFTGEALLGIQGESELGPLVVFGLGGIFTEALGKVGGRMAPFGLDDARALVEEFRDVKVMHGFRGRPAWDIESLAAIFVAAGKLAAGGREWIASLDVNPLLYGPDGFQAVDALLLLRSA